MKITTRTRATTVLSLILFLSSSCWIGAQDVELAEGGEDSNEATLALKALVDFVTAETWEDAAKLALDGEELKPRMEAHYKQFEWKPIVEPEIVYNRSTKVSGDVVYFTHDFEVRPKDRSALPVLLTVVQNGDKFFIDWEIFSQLHDLAFETFVKERTMEPRSFRVSGVRGVPGPAEAKIPLEGGVERLRIRWRPGIAEAVSVYAGKSTDAGQALSKIASWEHYRPYRIKVRWVVSEEESFVELLGVEAINFRKPSVISD
ncbi:MAG: hypothetical protein ACI8UO_000477 [Verrucomicrobiales bacterium]|jgi:hypothetical protein